MHPLLTSLIGLLVTGYWLLTNPLPSLAQCQTSSLNQGLISANSYGVGSNTIGNTDQTCVIDPQAVYRDFKVPSYADLENEFYTLSRSTAKRTTQLGNGNLTLTSNGIYLQTSNMTVNSIGPLSGGGVQIIFIRGNLDITGNIDYGDTDPYSGLVFITSGNIHIASNVTKVNAILISSGEICTAYQSGTCLSGNTDTPQLVINGSLISLNKLNLPGGINAVKLVRNLPSNTQASEVVNKQPKYLYLLRSGLFTKDLILTEEDKSYVVTANPAPPPPPTPPPDQVCPGSTDPLAINSNITAISNCVLSIFKAGS